MTIRYFYADSYICIEAFAMLLISNEVFAFWGRNVFSKKKRNHRWYLESAGSEEERKHLVGGTERALLGELGSLLLGDLLVDLGSLAGLVAVRSGLYGV